MQPACRNTAAMKMMFSHRFCDTEIAIIIHAPQAKSIQREKPWFKVVFLNIWRSEFAFEIHTCYTVFPRVMLLKTGDFFTHTKKISCQFTF